MPSPFPGMNPFLERLAVWQDFHETFIPVAREILSSQLLPRYLVRIEEHVFIHETEAEEWRLVGQGDVTVSEENLTSSQSAVQLLEAPATVRQTMPIEEGMAYLEIRDRDDQQVITVIKLLSPSNKNSGPDRERFIRKHFDILKSESHLVEIDLLRGGPRLPWLDIPPCDYCVVVSRRQRRPKAGIWPIRLRDRLPIIPIPLRSGDSDATLDLQQVLHRIYDTAGYHYFIYKGQPEPPLSAEDAAWAQGLIPKPE
jgi:hypothetical protein